MPLKILLAKWAVQQFDPPPADRTLRLWVRQGRIVPAPIKIGRAYWVEPTARHIAEVMADNRLVSRLRRG
ncbi:excisionase [Variovorax boronicumulans]|uniref:excisionase n=1 Tax=Variovorax boronicumulans TaxID=436515 RepID=UPI0027D79763|nr:excisionase [Variovorax boronicumulans]